MTQKEVYGTIVQIKIASNVFNAQVPNFLNSKFHFFFIRTIVNTECKRRESESETQGKERVKERRNRKRLRKETEIAFKKKRDKRVNRERRQQE